MYSEKRDFLIAYAIGNKQKACLTQAQNLISGFQSTAPKRWQNSFAEKQRIWNFQNDIVDHYQQIVYAHRLLGNMVNTQRYFQMKYPLQWTDWDKELK